MALGDIPAGGASTGMTTWGPPQPIRMSIEKILEMLMAPYRELAAQRERALQAQTDAQMELARRNTNLTLGDIADARAQARRNLQNVLAGNGLIDSGSKPYGLTKIDKMYKRQSQNAENQLQALLASLASGLAASRLDNQQNLLTQQSALGPAALAQNQAQTGYEWLDTLGNVARPRGY